MIYLFLSILCATLLGVVFQLFQRYDIDTFQAIIYNYIVCLIVGTLVMGELPVQGAFWELDWFPYAFLMGTIFIGTFVLIARTVQHFGMAVTSVVQRMSLLVSVIFAIIMFNEPVNAFKIIGVLLALAAVILASWQPSEESDDEAKKINWRLLALPISVFLCSGTVECVLQYVQKVILKGDLGQLQFTTVLFGTAAIMGFFMLIFSLVTGRMVFRFKNVIAGIVLGVPNFGSIYFLLKILDIGWDSSVAFPINNIGVILCSTLIGVFIFHHPLSKWNKIGVACAVVAIVLMAFSQI